MFLQRSPLFGIGGPPVFSLTAGQAAYITSSYHKMLAERRMDCVFKNELIRTCIQLLLHEALRMQPAENFSQPKNASSRITTLLLKRLKRLGL